MYHNHQKLIFPQLFNPQLIVIHKDSHVAMNPKEVSRIIINSSLGFIANYHALLTSLRSNWKIVNGYLGKCADEHDIEAIEIFTRSPTFLSLCLCISKRYQNILVTKLTLFGDSLKSLSK